MIIYHGDEKKFIGMKEKYQPVGNRGKNMAYFLQTKT